MSRDLYRFAARKSSEEPFRWVTKPRLFTSFDDPTFQGVSERLQKQYPGEGNLKYACVRDEGKKGSPWRFAEVHLGIGMAVTHDSSV